MQENTRIKRERSTQKRNHYNTEEKRSEINTKEKQIVKEAQRKSSIRKQEKYRNTQNSNGENRNAKRSKGKPMKS